MADQNSTLDLSVVLPALNEEASLDSLLTELKTVLADINHEILLINDASTDQTPQIGEKHGVRVITQPYCKGNGAAIKRGIREAKGKIILMMDADGQHNPKDIPKLLSAIETHDMAVGARSKGTRQQVHRWAANRMFSMLASYLAGEHIPDLTSGFRAIRAEIAKRYVELLPNTFSYPSTLTVTLARAGYTIAHVPIIAGKRQGKSKIRLASDGLRFLLIILKVGVGLAPFKIFFPTSLATFLLGLGWYIYTYLESSRFTNMSLLLFCTSVIILMMGLVAEQIALLRRERRDE
jgi:glycosyltransferase involved in cell wall biosynthesis